MSPSVKLTSDKKTKAPLAGFADSVKNVSGGLTKIFYENGLSLFSKWDYIFISPPLIITQKQIDDMVTAIEKGLEYTDLQM